MFTCDFCNFASVRTTLFLDHLVVHEKTRNFAAKCLFPPCSSSYVTVRNLKDHLRRKHKFFMRSKVVCGNIDEPSTSSHGEGLLLRNVSAELPSDANIDDGNDNRSDISQLSDQDIISGDAAEGRDVIAGMNRPHEGNREENLTKQIGKMLIELREENNLTSKAMAAVTEKMEDIVELTVKATSRRVSRYLEQMEQPGPPGLQDMLLNDVDIKPVLHSLNSQKKLEKFARSDLHYIPPTECILGYNEKHKPETVQYVPIKETITWLLSFDDIFRYALTDAQSQDDFLRDICDGQLYRCHPIISQPGALFIILYMDEFTLTNPLRVHSKQHKLLGMYFQLGNIPPERRSLLDSILLVSLCRSVDAKKHGMATVFQWLIQDLQNMARNGITINQNGLEINLKCDVLLFVSDNLGAHQIGGFIEAFNIQFPCRFCLVSKEELQSGLTGPKRTPDTHDAQVASVKQSPYLSSSCGIKGPSFMSDLPHFHCTTGLPSDIAHDLFEGVARETVSEVVRHCVVSGYFELQELNRRVEIMPYTSTDKCDKPNVIPASFEVKQTFSQMWCLFRLLPIMIGEYVPADDALWNMYLGLRTVVEYMCARKITKTQVEVLRQLIRQFIADRRHVLPNLPIKPKHHYMLHYCDQILQFGPLVHVWTLRFEAKHNQLAQIWKPSQCSKNISKSLANRHQFRYALHTDRNYFKPQLATIHKGKLVTLRDTAPVIRNLLLGNLVDGLDAEFIIGTSLSEGSVTFARKSVIVLSAEHVDGLPFFTEPRYAIMYNNAYFLVCQSLKTICYNKHYHCFVCRRVPELGLLQKDSIEDKVSLGLYDLPQSNDLAVTLKHKLA